MLAAVPHPRRVALVEAALVLVVRTDAMGVNTGWVLVGWFANTSAVRR
jgi:hypothetical protein